MLMEGAIKHACPEYSAEFRHGLIERAEKGVPIITVRKIEKYSFDGETLTEQLQWFLNNRYSITKYLSLDAYERMLLDRYCSSQ